MIKSTFFEVLDTTWPTLVIFLTIIILLRVFTILNTSKKFILHEELLLLLFITYILFLFELVTSRDVYMNGTNLVPFREMFRYPVGSENFNRQVIGNILLFMPFGFFATYYTKIKKISSISFMSILISLTIEVVQKYIGRSFDVDDIILNVVGGILGFLVYIGLDAIRKKLPSIFQKDGFYNFLSILLVIIICLYLFGIISFG
jgi:glycopeptide antibiotics resistance protein